MSQGERSKATTTTRKPRILLSGGNGFLAMQLMPRLLEFADVTAIAPDAKGFLKADLALWNGGIHPDELKGQFDIFVHLAGQYDLRAEHASLYLHNVAGTHTALAIAQKAEIPHFVITSTIAVTMNQRRSKDPISPDSLSTVGRFPDAYGETNAHAERLAREWVNPHLKSRMILRMGAMVGDTTNGKIARIDGPYHAPARFAEIASLLERIPGPVPLPGHGSMPIPMVPVDCAASAIARAINRSFVEDWKGTRSAYVLPANAPTAEEFFRSLFRFLGINKEPKFLGGVPSWIMKPAAQLLAKLPKEELEYLINSPTYDLASSREIFGTDWCLPFSAYEQAFWRGYEEFISNR